MFWQNGDDRLYAVQDLEAPEAHLRGRFRTRVDGSYAFVAVRPVPYTILDDGPVGRMLARTGRHPWRPAHIHLIVRAPGYRTVATHVFDSATSLHLDSDAVFAVKPSLADFARRWPTTRIGRQGRGRVVLGGERRRARAARSALVAWRS